MSGRRAAPSLIRRGSSDELERLRKRVDQQERSLAVLAQALSALRRANAGLRAENREVHLELERVRRAGRTTRDAAVEA